MASVEGLGMQVSPFKLGSSNIYQTTSPYGQMTMINPSQSRASASLPYSNYGMLSGGGSINSQMMMLMQTMMLMFMTLLAAVLKKSGLGSGGEKTDSSETPPTTEEVPPFTDKPPADTPEEVDPTKPPENKPATGKSAQTIQMDGGGPNRTILSNHGDKPIQVCILTNPTPDSPNKESKKITIKPGETVTVEMPQGWAGRISKYTGDGTKSTLNEVTFDGHGGQMFYDQSVIDGYNGPVTMTPTNAKTSGNGRPVTVGSKKDITHGAPTGMKITNPDGSICLDGVAPVGDNASKPENQKYYLDALGEGTAYTYPKDDVTSTRIVQDNSINIDFF
jgi:hypothetical protein